MIALLWIILILLLGIIVLLIISLFSKKPWMPHEIGISEQWVNLTSLSVAVVSIIIALTSYSEQKESGAEQQKVLVASRQALEQVATTLLEQSRRDAEQRDRRPLILASIGDTQLSETKLLEINVRRSDLLHIDLILINKGTKSLTRPIILVLADPQVVAVTVFGKGSNNTDRKYVLQFNDLVSAAIEIGRPYRFSFALEVPETLKDVNLTIAVVGGEFTMPDLHAKLHIQL